MDRATKRAFNRKAKEMVHKHASLSVKETWNPDGSVSRNVTIDESNPADGELLLKMLDLSPAETEELMDKAQGQQGAEQAPPSPEAEELAKEPVVEGEQAPATQVDDQQTIRDRVQTGKKKVTTADADRDWIALARGMFMAGAPKEQVEAELRSHYVAGDQLSTVISQAMKLVQTKSTKTAGLYIGDHVEVEINEENFDAGGPGGSEEMKDHQDAYNGITGTIIGLIGDEAVIENDNRGDQLTVDLGWLKKIAGILSPEERNQYIEKMKSGEDTTIDTMKLMRERGVSVDEIQDMVDEAYGYDAVGNPRVSVKKLARMADDPDTIQREPGQTVADYVQKGFSPNIVDHEDYLRECLIDAGFQDSEIADYFATQAQSGPVEAMKKQAIIRKNKSGTYDLYSHKGKHLFGPASHEDCEKREKQVEYFKNQGSMNKTADRTVARWESRGGKFWIELRTNDQDTEPTPDSEVPGTMGTKLYDIVSEDGSARNNMRFNSDDEAIDWAENAGWDTGNVSPVFMARQEWAKSLKRVALKKTADDIQQYDKVTMRGGDPDMIGTVTEMGESPYVAVPGMVVVRWPGGTAMESPENLVKVAMKKTAESAAQYLQTFFEEKGLTPQSWEIEGNDGYTHFIDSDVVIEAIMGAPENEQQGIADMIRKIDFANGDVNKYLEHLAKGLVNMGQPAEASLKRRGPVPEIELGTIFG